MSKPRSAINLISLIVKSIKPNDISLQSWLTVEVGAQLDLPARRELRNLTNNQPTDQTRKKATNLYKMGKFLLITPLAILFLFNISATAEYCRAGWHKVREPAKDLIDSEDPKHTLFCRETAFVAIYAL